MLAKISKYLNIQNKFSLNNSQDLSARLCHAWFIAQDKTHPEYKDALALLDSNPQHPVVKLSWAFQCLAEKELGCFDALPESTRPMWSLFSPEALDCKTCPDAVGERIRHDRTIQDMKCVEPVLTDVADQLLMTSNILLGLPLEGDDISHLDLGDAFHQKLAKAQQQAQQYWYDHPIPIGIPADENEILYGLQNLDQALEIEVRRGNLAPSQKLTVLLSCSVTHPALSDIARQYVEYEIKTNLKLRHLEIVLFSEQDCRAILAAAFPKASQDLEGVFGVDGAYGRHYTFLKAIAALWQKAINPHLKATFKMDLDQVFDQSALISETGQSAFGHFLQTQWGTSGMDSEGKAIELGAIAGGVVNQSDVHLGLFTADVKRPLDQDLAMFEQIFCPRWGQALSTEEEITTRRKDIQRIHVTGGVNGILIESLYRYQPFTPTFIHRAEDQAFALSFLANPVKDHHLACIHQPGLIMRHDKDVFAKRAIQASSAGKLVGDIERILLFSAYARYHSLGPDRLRQILYPFSGAFISKTPTALALLRFMLEGCDKNADYLDSGADRLLKCLHFCQNSLEKELISNKKGWREYYASLQHTELNDFAKTTLRNCILNQETNPV